MDRTERFYKIDQLLKDSKVVSFARLRDSLGVSRATLKRDLVYMRDRFNAPIEYVRAGNGYRFGKPRAGPRYELPGLWFNATEIFALLTTLQLLYNLLPVQQARLEIVEELQGRQQGVDLGRYELACLWLIATEIYALLTTLQLLNNLQPGLLDGQVPALVERLHGILGRGDHSWQEIQERIRIFQPERRGADAGWFSVIAAALLKRSRLWIR